MLLKFQMWEVRIEEVLRESQRLVLEEVQMRCLNNSDTLR